MSIRRLLFPPSRQPRAQPHLIMKATCLQARTSVQYRQWLHNINGGHGHEDWLHELEKRERKRSDNDKAHKVDSHCIEVPIRGVKVGVINGVLLSTEANSFRTSYRFKHVSWQAHASFPSIVINEPMLSNILFQHTAFSTVIFFF